MSVANKPMMLAAGSAAAMTQQRMLLTTTLSSSSSSCICLKRRRFGTTAAAPYKSRKGWDWQKKLFDDRIRGRDSRDVLLLMQHTPVYTLGHRATEDNLKFDPNEHPEYELFRTERGGEITCHCPGQIVGYPIIDLNFYKKDLHWYLRMVEEVVIRVLGKLGLRGERDSGLTGVWLEGHKVAAVGIKVSRWITMHGFALNVDADLHHFDNIIPCGIDNKPVGSLAQFIPGIQRHEVTPLVVEAFNETFNAACIDTPFETFHDMVADVSSAAESKE